MDFTSFGEESFNAKKWINDALRASGTDGAEAFVSTMVMKLQLMSQEVSSSFEESSTQALVRMPRAQMEVDRVAKEARGLRQTLSQMLQAEVTEAQSETAKSIDRMNALHEVKRKLDVCQQTIAHAAHLAQAVKRMDTIFEQGDLPQIGAEIHKMQTALEALKGYPEQYQRFLHTIAQFETRLVGMVEKDCLAALVGRQVAAAQHQLQTLHRINKDETVVRQFILQSTQPILEFWTAAAPTDFAAWLPLFFAEIKQLIQRERTYYEEVFGKPLHVKRMTDVVTCVLASLEPPLQQRLEALALPQLVDSYVTTHQLFRYCEDDVLSDPALDANLRGNLRNELETAIYQPFTNMQRDYSAAEKSYLQGRIREFEWVKSTQEGQRLSPSLVKCIAESVTPLFVLLEGALHRCMHFTEGVEAQGFVLTLNEVSGEYSDMIQALVRKAPPAEPAEDATPSASLAPNESAVRVGLQLHQVCTNVLAKLEQFEGIVKTEVLAKRATVLGKTGSPHRLLKDNVPKSTSVANFFRSLDQLKVPVFGITTKKLQLLAKEVERTAIDALLQQVRGRLSQLPRLEVWTAVNVEDAAGGYLQPTELIRQVGEFLFELPLLIETYLGGAADGKAAEEMPQYFADIVLRTTVDLLMRSVQQIRGSTDRTTSPHGLSQLVADLEYFDVRAPISQRASF
eukprot:TRINITY_DN19335_c0_g1_i1.p1 TRINITY_DN19335_c0_g1~~TRINITY_DN19335_c0_g1_i1.p1  ORF type:complete len:682 (+),score=172.69 TRINITY_DN19335_c0_g1_i1:63-2108(+)